MTSRSYFAKVALVSNLIVDKFNIIIIIIIIIEPTEHTKVRSEPLGVCDTSVPTTMNGALFMLVLLLISVSGQVLMLGQAQEWAYEVGKAITAGM